MEFEAPMCPREIARKSGWAVSESIVRDACHRQPDQHPLPHFKAGKTRPILKIRWSDFCQWYDEEVHRALV